MTHLVRTARQPLFEPRTPLERRLVGTLWSVRSPIWSGYMDFQEPGHYFTHWGFGTWRSLDEQRARLQNTYDPFWFDLLFDDELVAFRTTHTNHQEGAKLDGDLIWDYVRQEPPPGWQRRQQTAQT